MIWSYLSSKGHLKGIMVVEGFRKIGRPNFLVGIHFSTKLFLVYLLTNNPYDIFCLCLARALEKLFSPTFLIFLPNLLISDDKTFSSSTACFILIDLFTVSILDASKRFSNFLTRAFKKTSFSSF